MLFLSFLCPLKLTNQSSKLSWFAQSSTKANSSLAMRIFISEVALVGLAETALVGLEGLVEMASLLGLVDRPGLSRLEGLVVPLVPAWALVWVQLWVVTWALAWVQSWVVTWALVWVQLWVATWALVWALVWVQLWVVMWAPAWVQSW